MFAKIYDNEGKQIVVTLEEDEVTHMPCVVFSAEIVENRYPAKFKLSYEDSEGGHKAAKRAFDDVTVEVARGAAAYLTLQAIGDADGPTH
jgi:hypothetical protein